MFKPIINILFVLSVTNVTEGETYRHWSKVFGNF